MDWIRCLGFFAGTALVGGCLGPRYIELEDGSSTGGDESGTSNTPSATSQPGTTATPPSPPGSASADDPSGEPPNPSTVTTASPTATATAGIPPDCGGGLPDGSQCEADEECESCQCYVMGVLGGICGACNGDDDCPEGGCSLPDPITSQPSYCNSGELGGGCETDGACASGLLCGTVVEFVNVVEVKTCGECLSDAQCDPGLTCQPDVAIAELSGVLQCVPVGSIGNGGSCDIESGTGDAACASGMCAPATLRNLLEVGVCSDCVIDDDCGPMQVCVPPAVDLVEGLIPGYCMPA